MAFLWALAGSSRTPLAPFYGLPQAAPPKAANPDNPCNPCNPGAAKAGNPCNPGAAKAGNPCNPCNPNARQAANPCNPDARQAANPCNPDARQAANPCNPDARQAANPCNPGGTDNPCNPGSASRVGLQTGAGKIDWGREFKSWDAVTGYVISNSHGNRLVQTYIYPSEAVRVYKHNAELARLRKTEGYLPYPRGTQIVQESWLRNELGGPGRPGPVFFMRKEPGGYDASGGDWRYGFTRNDLSVVGEGHEGKMQFCKECHSRAERRDFVFATDR
jgi:hypothetical protein